MRHHTLLITPLLAALVVCAPASAADTVVAELQRPSTIRTYAGIQVFSAFDGRLYHLAIRRGGAIEQLPAGPSAVPFDVDIGPDRKGRPQLIYTRCRSERREDYGYTAFGTNGSQGCDLVTRSLARRGGGERLVEGANTADGNEFAPTLWKGRIAFARQTPGRNRPLVYTRSLSAPRSRPSTRLPSIPKRTTTRGILELDLSGRHLAQRVFYSGRAEVRLVDISTRSVRRLARTGVGEGGQYFTGIGFADGYLGWVSGWLVGGGAVTPGIYRYRISTGELARAPFPRGPRYYVVAFALFDANGAYMLDGYPGSEDDCGTVEGSGVVERCRLHRIAPLRFRPVRR
jgi:hypothetical protein